MTGAAAPPAAPAQTPPGVARRLAAFLYEGVLLFGLVMAVGLAYGLATNQRHALVGAPGLRLTLFVVLGLYFVYFWSRHGQTLAMKTWHLRVQTRAGQPPGALRAAARYLLAWLWFVPALATVNLAGLKSGGAVTAIVITGVLAYAALARLRGDRQLPHDLVCGTCIVDARPPRASPPK